jgi:hypothetical protein
VIFFDSKMSMTLDFVLWYATREMKEFEYLFFSSSLVGSNGHVSQRH